jgi:hypothetical protein
MSKIDDVYKYTIKNGNEYIYSFREHDFLNSIKWCKELKYAKTWQHERSTHMFHQRIKNKFPESFVLEIELREIRICRN